MSGMTGTTTRPRTPPSGRRPAADGWVPVRLPAVGFVVTYAVLLLAIPSQLIFLPLGSPGTPANLVGVGALVWWLAATLGGQNPVKRFTPTRVSVLLLTCTVLASYVSAMLQGWHAPADVMVRAADRGLLSFAAWLGIVLMAAEGLRSWRDVELVVEWLAWLGTFVAALGIVQFFTGLDIAGFFVIPGLSANSEFGAVIGRSVLNRVSATAVHPIEYGVVLGALLPLLVHPASQHRYRR